jgi:HEAT repeat protein
VIGGEAVAATAALCAASSALLATVLSRTSNRADTVDVDAEMRLVLFRAIDEGDLDPSVLESLTNVEHRTLETQARTLLPNLRGEDRVALGRLLDRLGAVEAARHQAHSKRAGVRAEAGEFLGEAGTAESVSELLELLIDPDPKVRWSAARGLGRVGQASAVAPLLSSLEGTRSVPVDVVADAIVEIRDCPIAVLRQGLGSPSVPMRAVSVELLGRFQALAAADQVIDILHHDPSVEVRARAARSLGRMGSPRATQALLASVESGPVAMRAQAIWALGEIGAPEAVPVLRATLLSETHHLGDLAADALSAMGQIGVDVLTQVAAGSGQPAATALRLLAARKDLQPAA